MHLVQYAEKVTLSLQDNVKEALHCSSYECAIVHEELIDSNHQGPAAVMNIKWLNFKHLRLSRGWLKETKLRNIAIAAINT